MHRRGAKQLPWSVRWPECVAEAGLPEGLRFRDLRQTGDTSGALILFAAFTGLRWGRLVVLRVCDLDLEQA
jgi:hypothetical protein